MARVAGIHHVSLLVSDTRRALQFYAGVLGLATDDTRPDLGYPGAWLSVGRAQLHLLELPDPLRGLEPVAHGGRDRHVALAVDDLDALASRLHESAIDYTLSRSGRRALFCRDPDGNAVELVETATGAGGS